LPTATLLSSTKIVRVHSLRFGTIFFGPGHDNTCDRRFPPHNRFDSSIGRFGVLYAARTIDGAVIETILRSPQVRHVPFGPISLLALTELTLRRPLRLVAMHGPGLSRLGLTNAISTGPYPPCQAWTGYLRAHPDKPDGIAYLSRHDPKQICYAMFEPAEPLFDAADPTPFATMMPRIKAILANHGKILLTR
jgi:hypothetical protein